MSPSQHPLESTEQWWEEVCGPCKGDPADLFPENQPRGGQQLCKVRHLDPFLLVPFELDPSLRQHVNGVLGIHVFTGSVVCARKWGGGGGGGGGGEGIVNLMNKESLTV